MTTTEYTHRDKCAIAGIGATDFSRDSGRTELSLATEASLAALADAGLTAADVDGIIRCDMDNVRGNDLAHSLGIRDLTYIGENGPAGRRRAAWSARRSPRSSPGRPRRCSCSAA